MRSFFLACLFLIVALDLRAETFNVTRIDDPLPDACVPGDCSLREAMLSAAANDPFADVDVIMMSLRMRVPSEDGGIVNGRDEVIATSR